MRKTDYWASAPVNRQQITLFSPTLDSMIGEDDPVRLVDEVLSRVDWSLWEAEYDGSRGQPPIHPRFVAGAILYGLCRRIRSSRKLEEACAYRVDFMWLVERRHIDYSTFCKFRTKFAVPLKDLFKQLGRIAMTMGLIRLGEVAFDGTRVRANNSRYNTRTAKTLEEKLAGLDEQFDQMMADAAAADSTDRKQRMLEGDGDGNDSPTHLPPELADIQQRREKVRQAFEKATAADEARLKQGVNPEKNPAQIPTSDPDSRVMPNKEGGYAPNYTPTVTTDGHRGFIVDCDVTNQVNESALAVSSVDEIKETFAENPERFLTDGGNNSGHVMQQMEERGVEFYAPVESSQPQTGNPALRPDPTQPVPDSEWDTLPRNNQKQLDKSCFVYDDQQDQYYCPQGHAMAFEKKKPAERGGVRINRRVYRCTQCTGCPMASLCVSPKNKNGRTITRDEFEEVRERTAMRMATEEGKSIYNRRPQIGETAFGLIKRLMGLRQFLLKGLSKVKTEWRWATTAFNLGKLVREIGRMRAKIKQLIAAVEF